MAGGWGCPHEVNDICTRINGLPCDPGMKGCVLAGRYFFFSGDEKNERLRIKRAREATQSQPGSGDGIADRETPPAQARQDAENE